MKALIQIAFAWAAMLLLGCIQSIFGQTTRPSYTVAVWFQPPANFSTWKSRGINTLIGEEVGNPATMTAEQYVQKAADAGLFVISKAGVNAGNVVGFFHSIDEPNAKAISPDKLKPDYDRFRAINPNQPIYLSLAGDAVTNSQPWKLADYQKAATMADCFIVNAYSMNRNATRYPTTWTATAISKLAPMVGGKPIVAMVECDWQRLATNPAGVGRAPTAAEVEGTVMSSIVAGGARGVGYFATVVGNATSGPGDVPPGWPARYDQTQPDVDSWMKMFHPRLQTWASGRSSSFTDPKIAEIDAIIHR